MKKRILSMLLVVCMVLSLLPATTLHFHTHAEETADVINRIQINGAYNVDFTADAKYLLTDDAGAVSGTAVTDETTDPWNIKCQVVDGVNVITLKGAKIGHFDEATGTFSTKADTSALNGNPKYTPAPLKIVVQEDSSIAATAYNINGNTSITSVTIESVGDAKLDMIHNGGYSGIAVDEVNFVNANVTLERFKTDYLNTALLTCKKLNVTGGDVSIVGSTYSGANYAVRATESAVINGAKFYLENTRYAKGLITPNLTITGGADVTLTTSTGYTGMLEVTDAVVEGDSSLYVYSVGSQAIVANGTFTVNSGTVKANCAITPMTGALVVNGGHVILQSRSYKPFATVTPVVAEGQCFTVKSGSNVDETPTNTQSLEFLSGGNTYQRHAEIIFAHDYTVATDEKVLDATGQNPAQYRAKCSKCGAASDTALVGVGEKATGTKVLTLLTEYNGWVKIDFVDGYARYFKVTDDTGTLAALNGADEIDAILNDTWNVKLEVIDGEAVMTLNGAHLGKYDAATDTYASKNGNHAFSGNAGQNYGVVPGLRVITKKDSSIATLWHAFNSNGSFANLTFESVGDAKLTITTGGEGYAPIQGITNLSFVNANVEIDDTTTADNAVTPAFTCKTLYMKDSNVSVTKRIYPYANKMITASESIVIDGGSFIATTDLHGSTLSSPSVTIKGGAKVTLNAGSSGITECTQLTIQDVGTKLTVHGQTGAVGAPAVTITGDKIAAKCSSQPNNAMTSTSLDYALSALSVMKQVEFEILPITPSVTLPGGVVLTTDSATNSVSYAKVEADGTVSAADESAWNLKLAMVDGVPTLYLKGANIGSVADGVWSVEQAMIAVADTAKLNIVVLENSTLTAKGSAVSGVSDLTITSEGDAKLTLVNHGDVFGLNPTTLTIDANLVMNTNGMKQWGKCISVTTLNIVGGNVVIDSMTDTYTGKPGVYAETINISGDANVTINNSLYGYAVETKSLTVSDNAVVNLNAPTVVLSIIDSLTVNGGALNVLCTGGQGGGTESGIIVTETGAITVNGGALNVDKVKNANWMHGIWIKGAGSFTVNGGTVVANSGSAHSRYGLYLQAGGTAVINGGDVTITGYDHRDTVDAEGNSVVTNYDMGKGAVYVGEGASLTVKGGKATFRSGITPVVGLLTVEDGEVILIAHKYTGKQFLNTVPVLPENVCISMSNSEALDGADPIGSSIDMLTKAQAYRYCRIGAHAEGEKHQEIIDAPTCNAPGSASQVIRCQHCFKLISSSDSVEVPATGVHTPGEVVIENIVAPGATTNGSHDEVTYCKDCGIETSRNTVVDEAVGDRPAITVETVTVAPGTESVVVKVSISNNPGIICGQLLVSYDADKLELVSYADGKLLNGWTTHSTNELNNNPAMFTWDDALASENNTANGVILTLTFNVKEGATGNAVITLSYDPENFFNYDFENVEFVPVNGAVNIQEAHVHAYDKVTVVPPTETEQGYTLHECKCGDSYKDNYTDPVAPAGPVDVNNVDGWFTVTNDDDANTGWVVSIFYMGENTVDDPVNDWTDLVTYGKMFPEMNGVNGYRMYKTLDPVLISKAGNYAVRVRYTDAEGAVQLIAKVITVETVATRINIVNNKVVITGLPENPALNLSVYYLGDQNVSAEDYNALNAAGKNYPLINGENGYRNYASTAAIYLGNVGNYAIRATYRDAAGVRQLLTSNFSIAEAVPGISVADNRLSVNGVPVGTATSISVFYLGNKTVNDPSTDWADLVRIGKENTLINSAAGYRNYSAATAVYLGNIGNYAIRVAYKDAEGNDVLLADQFVIDSVIPGVTIANNKLSLLGFPAGSNPAISVFFLGEETVADPVNGWSELVTIGKKNTAVNGTAGYRSYSDPNAVYLGNIGNYCVRAAYTDSTGARQTIAVQLYIDTVVAGINVSNNRITLVGVPYGSYERISVAYLGEYTVTDPIKNWVDAQRIGKNNYADINGNTGYKYYDNKTNEIFLGNTGNYVIRLVYKDINGVQQINAVQVNIDSVSDVPTIKVNANNKVILTSNPSNLKIRGYSIYYLGEEKATNIDDGTLLASMGKNYSSVNGTSGYKFYQDVNAIKFPQTGNYVIRLNYYDAAGNAVATAIQQTITVN